MDNQDWRTLRAQQLQQKQAEFFPRLQSLLDEYGLVLKATIIVSQDGDIAQARIIVDLRD